jgi:hypothetical protein
MSKRSKRRGTPAQHPIALAWRAKFGDALPVGFHCRDALATRWLRIHSLPESKRYPHTEAEYAELLKRHNAVASQLLGEGSECVLFVTRYQESTEWQPSNDVPIVGTPELVLFAERDGEPIIFFALPVTWRAYAFDSLLRAAADDRTGSLLFANFDASSIYAPYDGGADLFFPDAESVMLARRKYSSWLSKNIGGM